MTRNVERAAAERWARGALTKFPERVASAFSFRLRRRQPSEVLC